MFMVEFFFNFQELVALVEWLNSFVFIKSKFNLIKIQIISRLPFEAIRSTVNKPFLTGWCLEFGDNKAVTRPALFKVDIKRQKNWNSKKCSLHLSSTSCSFPDFSSSANVTPEYD